MVAIIQLSIVIAFLMVYVIIGILSRKLTKNVNEYLFAGGKMSALLVMATIFGDVTGGGSSVGVAQDAFEMGIWTSIFAATAVPGLMLFALIFVRIYRRAEVKIFPEALGKMYGKRVMQSTVLVGLSAGPIVQGVEIAAVAYVLAAVLGIGFVGSVALTIVTVTVYTIIGGLWALSYVNIMRFVQIPMVLLALPLCIGAAGGWENIVATIPSHFNPLPLSVALGWLLSRFLNTLMAGPKIQLTAAAESEGAARKGILASLLLISWFSVPYAIIGMCARVINPELPSGLAAGYMAMAINPWVGGLLLVTMIGAVLTVADTLVLGYATIATRAVYVPFRPKSTDRQQLRASRLITLLFGVMAFFMALFVQNVITWIIFLAALGTPYPLIFLMGLVWKRATSEGAIAGIAAGTIASSIWHVYFQLMRGAGPPAIVAVFVATPLALIIVSLLTQKRGHLANRTPFLAGK